MTIRVAAESCSRFNLSTADGNLNGRTSKALLFPEATFPAFHTPVFGSYREGSYFILYDINSLHKKIVAKLSTPIPFERQLRWELAGRLAGLCPNSSH